LIRLKYPPPLKKRYHDNRFPFPFLHSSPPSYQHLYHNPCNPTNTPTGVTTRRYQVDSEWAQRTSYSSIQNVLAKAGSARSTKFYSGDTSASLASTRFRMACSFAGLLSHSIMKMQERSPSLPFRVSSNTPSPNGQDLITHPNPSSNHPMTMMIYAIHPQPTNNQ